MQPQQVAPGPAIVAAGITRRVVIHGNCVWIEENRSGQRGLAVLLAIATLMVLAVPFIPAMLHSGDASRTDTPGPEVVVVAIFAAFSFSLYRASLRSRPSIAPAHEPMWQRIACADPARGWFWTSATAGVPLAEVRVSIRRTFGFVQMGKPLRWSFEMRWRNETLRILLAPDDGLAGLFLVSKHPPAWLVQATQVLQQWGFAV